MIKNSSSTSKNPISLESGSVELEPQENLNFESLSQKPDSEQELLYPTRYVKDLERSVAVLNNEFRNYKTKLNKKVKDTQDKIDEQFTTQKKEFDGQIITQKDKFDKKIQNSSSQVIALLGIFTTLFTFISVNITIFQQVKTVNEAVFFMAMMAAFCAVIVSVPILILQAVNGSNINPRPIWSICITGFLVLVLIAWIPQWSNFELTTCEDKQKNLIIPLP